MTDATATVDRYLAALNEPDADTRRALIEQAWTPHGSLTDPPVEGVGHDGLAAVGDMLHEHYADQAHLSRDFRAVLGFTPSSYRASRSQESPAGA